MNSYWVGQLLRRGACQCLEPFYTSSQCWCWIPTKKLVRDMSNILLKFPPITATKTWQKAAEDVVGSVHIRRLEERRLWEWKAGKRFSERLVQALRSGHHLKTLPEFSLSSSVPSCEYLTIQFKLTMTALFHVRFISLHPIFSIGDGFEHNVLAHSLCKVWNSYLSKNREFWNTHNLLG